MYIHNRKTILLFAFLGVLLSCKDKENSCGANDNSPTVIKAPLVISDIQQDSIVERIDFLALETTDECLIADATRMELTDSLIFLGDLFERVLVFDRTGKFSHQISRKGSGPGEYLEVRDFLVRDDSIIDILDYKRIHSYTFSGRHLRTLSFDFSSGQDLLVAKYFARAKDGYYLWGRHQGTLDPKMQKDHYLMYRVNEDFEILERYFKVQNGDGWAIRKFHSFNDILIIEPTYANYNIYQLDTAGVASVRYVVDFGDKGYHAEIESNYDRHKILEDRILEMFLYSEIENWVHCLFKYRGAAYTLLYSKKRNETYIIDRKESYLTDPDYIFFIQAMRAYNNQFVGYMDASIFKDKMRYLSEESKVKYGLDGFDHVDGSDNPILMFYTMK